MPRKAKITAVPIDVQPDQTLEQVDDPEPKTDAEKMTDVINEVNVSEHVLPNEDESSIQKAPKARAKRVSKKEPNFPLVCDPSGKDTEPEVEATSSFDEVQAEVVMSKQEPEVEPKVACPDCGKKMSVKTLKYSHGPNCVIQKQKQSQENEEYAKTSYVAKQIVREIGGEHEANTLDAFAMLDSLNNFSNHDI